jgi:hypothetical protein
MSIIPPFRRLRQENIQFKFKSSLSYIMRPCLEVKKKNKKPGLAEWLKW